MLRPRILEHTIQPTTQKVVAFADDLIIMIEAESVGETKKIANIELKKIAEWAVQNKN